MGNRLSVALDKGERMIFRYQRLVFVQCAQNEVVVRVEQERAALVAHRERVEHLFQTVELVLENDRRERGSLGVAVVPQRKGTREDGCPASRCKCSRSAARQESGRKIAART